MLSDKLCHNLVLAIFRLPMLHFKVKLNIDIFRVGDELRTNLEAIKARIEELGPSSVLCVFSTTSCFAPRAHDNIPEIAQICKDYSIPHLGRFKLELSRISDMTGHPAG